ncbi:MAG: AAA family ATPase [Nitrospinaceae bacterium]
MSKVQQTDHYKILGVPRDATPGQIQWAFKKKMALLEKPPALTNQPVPSSSRLRERMALLREAFETLADPRRRKMYNRLLSGPPPQPAVHIPKAAPSPMSEAVSAAPGRTRESVYLHFFGFAEKPFDLTPNPKYLYLSAKHKEVLAHLVFGLQENNGFLKIVGEVGTGKTTIIRSFLRELKQGFSCAYIFHPCVTGLELLQSINEELGLPSDSKSKKELIGHLRQYLVRQRQAGNRVVVIIDEAQNLETGVLEELRLLSNLETETEKLIQIVLIGQPELEDLLQRPELRQLRQRITIQWNLMPLNREETHGYIQHRLSVAGGRGKVRFELPAMDLLHRYARGIPRMINVIADRALLIAYTENTRRITARLVRQTARDVGGLETRPHLKTAAWKLLAPGLALAAMAYFGLDAWGELRRSAPSPEPVDFRQILEKEPIQLPDPGRWVAHQLAPAPARAKDPALATSQAVSEPRPVAAAAPAPEAAPPAVSGDGVLQVTETRQLVRYLSSLTLEESQVEAAKWVLRDWGVLPDNLRRFSAESLGQLQENFGLSLYEINGSLRKLATLNHPALLEVTLPEGKGTKYLALLALDGERGRFGAVDPIEMSFAVLEKLWTRRALVVWRDFEPLPDELQQGFKGREAIWLQKNLRLLGFFKGREAPVYGPKTKTAVQSFQRRHGLTDHGRFDIETRILLYNLLTIYDTPQLRRS